jgi:hypothetical protein
MKGGSATGVKGKPCLISYVTLSTYLLPAHTWPVSILASPIDLQEVLFVCNDKINAELRWRLSLGNAVRTVTTGLYIAHDSLKYSDIVLAWQ